MLAHGSLASWLRHPEARFLIAGGIAALVNWLVRFPIELVLPFAAAVAVAMVIGMACGFVLYSRWVFPGSDRPLAAQIGAFILVNLAGQATMLVLAIIAREILLRAGLGVMLAGAAAHALGIAAGAIVNYLGHRHVTFSRRDPR